MKKGFTLVELLAVIVILAIITLVAVPTINRMVQEGKKNALKDSAYGLIESANYYYAQTMIKNSDFDKIEYNFSNGKQTSSNNELLEYKGNIQNGKLILTNKGEVALCIDDNTNYAYKNVNDTNLTTGKGICSYDGETGDFTIISDVDILKNQISSLQNELNDLKSKGNATEDDITKGKTAVVQGNLITGSKEQSGNLSTWKKVASKASSINKVTINCTNIDGYEKLTAADFIITPLNTASQYIYNESQYVSYQTWTKSYNASTGILTIGACYHANKDSYAAMRLTYTLYDVYVTKNS